MLIDLNLVELLLDNFFHFVQFGNMLVILAEVVLKIISDL